jgi:rare lipoprotein A
MVTNLNTIYQNKEENLNVNSKNKAVADTFEKVIEEREKYTHFQTGMASYYGGSWHGKKTANGEIFNENSLTAAHKTLPFGTKVKVTNLDNGKSVVVRINNRGPYSKGRVIDLSKAAFSKIASTSKGVTRVKLEVAK